MKVTRVTSTKNASPAPGIAAAKPTVTAVSDAPAVLRGVADAAAPLLGEWKRAGNSILGHVPSAHAGPPIHSASEPLLAHKRLAQLNLDANRLNEIKVDLLKINLTLDKIGQLLPNFMAMVGHRPPIYAFGVTSDSAARSQFAQWLYSEFRRAGIDIDPARVTELVDGIAMGGAAGMALAIFLVTAIAEASAGGTIRATTDPSVANGAAAAGFDAGTFAARLDQIADKAEAYANGPDEFDFFSFMPNQQYAANAAALLGAVFPGLESTGSAPLTANFATAQTEGIDVPGFTLTSDQFNTAVALLNQSPAATTAFLTAAFQAQADAKSASLQRQIE